MSQYITFRETRQTLENKTENKLPRCKHTGDSLQQTKLHNVCASLLQGKPREIRLNYIYTKNKQKNQIFLHT